VPVVGGVPEGDGVTPEEEATLGIRFFAYVCAAIGMQEPELRDWLLAEVRDGRTGSSSSPRKKAY
jgi:hypothetical protein